MFFAAEMLKLILIICSTLWTAWTWRETFNPPVTVPSLPFSYFWNRDSNRYLCQKYLQL